MNNENFYKRNSFFLDLDGTLVIHNCYPFSTPDILLPGVREFLKALKEQNAYCVLTTARGEIECLETIQMLKEECDFTFDAFVYSLPTGKRTVVNDNGSIGVKALAIAVERNGGMEHLDLETLK